MLIIEFSLIIAIQTVLPNKFQYSSYSPSRDYSQHFTTHHLSDRNSARRLKISWPQIKTMTCFALDRKIYSIISVGINIATIGIKTDFKYKTGTYQKRNAMVDIY